MRSWKRIAGEKTYINRETGEVYIYCLFDSTYQWYYISDPAERSPITPTGITDPQGIKAIVSDKKK